MPETKCLDCRAIFWGSTRARLLKWELEHHKTSYEIVEGKDCGFHKCREFQEFTDSGLPEQTRVYCFDALAEIRLRGMI